MHGPQNIKNGRVAKQGYKMTRTQLRDPSLCVIHTGTDLSYVK